MVHPSYLPLSIPPTFPYPTSILRGYVPSCILTLSSPVLMATDRPVTMLACHYYGHDLLRRSRVGQVPCPPLPGPGQLYVRVACASLNPADWKSAAGEQAALLNFQWPRVYGFDFSGTVAAVGGTDTGFAVGDRVFGMIRGLPQRDRGTLAEFVLVDADVCVRCPADVTHAECASVPLVAITAVKAFEACGLPPRPPSSPDSPGPRVLVLGGAGGVGSVAVQLVVALFGASHVATTASPAKAELCASLGATTVVDHRGEAPFAALAADGPYDAILDTTGEAKRCAPLLRAGGALVSILAGPTVEAVRTWLLEARVPRDSITLGVHPFLHSHAGGALFEVFSGAASLRRACERRGGRFRHVIGTGNGRIMRAVAALMARGSLRAVIDSEFPLADAAQAIARQRSGRATGKVVVRVCNDEW